MKWLLASPSADDFIRLLKAWRFWVLGVLLGALIGAATYYLFPPPYRAQATVVVDFNLEQAWPQETDRQLFYYLERETRKLVEVAWSDAVLEAVTARVGDVSVSDLRAGKLLLSQPGEGGWHFWADDPDPARAAQLASTWAEAFGERAQQGVTAALHLEALRTSLQTQCECQNAPDLQAQIQALESQSLGISPYIQVGVSQAAEMPLRRKTGLGTYLLAGAVSALALGAFLILFVDWKGLRRAS